VEVDPVRAPENAAAGLNPEVMESAPDPARDRSDRKASSVECQVSQLKALNKNPLFLTFVFNL